MPGLGPSLLDQFLAEATLKTQPGAPPTDPWGMVEPTRNGVTGRRAEGGEPSQLARCATSHNHSTFRSHLTGAALGMEPPGARRSSTRNGEDPGAPAAEPEPLRLDPREALAPDREAVRGDVSVVAGDADWLRVICPQAAETSPALAGAAALPEERARGEVAVAELVERWVKRVALGGDSRRGAARLDIGSGRLSGAEVLVVAQAGHVSVELSLPPGHADAGLTERLRARLSRRGYSADVSVR